MREMVVLRCVSPATPPLSHGCSRRPPQLRGEGPRRRWAPTGGAVRCATTSAPSPALRTCRHCKKQFDPSLNHPAACRFHTAHFGGETKRKFESVYTGGTLNTPDSGKVLQYWHCCGSEDPSDQGCTLGPHSSYDDDD